MNMCCRNSRAGEVSRRWSIIAAIAGVVLVGVAGAWFLSQPGVPAGKEQAVSPTVKPAMAQQTASSSAPAMDVRYGKDVDQAILTELTPVPVPTNGVFLRITYLGSFSGSYSVGDKVIPVKNSGPRLIELEDPAGAITATIRKDEPSRKSELVVEIWKDGTQEKSGSSMEPYGEVTVRTDT